MTGREIVQAEAKRIFIGILPLLALSFGAFALFGYASARTAVSLLAGGAYALALFVMIGANATRAMLYPEAQAMGVMRRGYIMRYLMTGVVVIFVLKTAFFNPAAAILPLFFPRIILLVGSIFPKKGG